MAGFIPTVNVLIRILFVYISLLLVAKLFNNIFFHFFKKMDSRFLRMHRKITLHLLLVALILVAKLLNNI